MIYYLLATGSEPIGRFLKSWGKPLASQLRPLTYEELLKQQVLQAGAYIFSEIDRLTPRGAEIVAEIWEQLSVSEKGFRLLNHPTRSMRRYELLRTLYQRGMNRFNVYRLSEDVRPRSYPVFLRGENDHLGPRTPLLFTEEELGAAVAKMLAQGPSREEILIVEFCDTSDANGLFRKYSAFRIRDRIIPRHIFFGLDWMQKHSALTEKEFLSEERHAEELREEQFYVQNNPYERELREIFELARIEYGRIDYGVLDGVPQVWEINTNPQIVGRSDQRAGRAAIVQYVSRQFISAFNEIDWPPYGMTLSSLDP